MLRGIVSGGLAREADLTARIDWFYSLIDLLKVRSRTIDDIVRQATPYLADQVQYDPEAVAKTWKDRDTTRDILVATREQLAAAPGWEPQALEEALRSLAESRGLGAGKLFAPLRVALTGLTASPGIFDVLTLLGRERSLERIDSAVRYITGNN